MPTKTRHRFEYLRPYGPGDQDLFLGRDSEIDRLYELVFESNVILVYGMAKTGKTSLVNCGLASRFSPSNWLLVHVRRGANLNDSLRNSLIAKLKELPEGLPMGIKQYSLGKLLYCLFLTYLKPVYLVFDQFEEIYLDGDAAERQQFTDDLEQIIHQQKRKTWREQFTDRISRLFETATEPDFDGKKTAKDALEKFKNKLKAVRRGVQGPNLTLVDDFLTELNQLCDQQSPQKAIKEIKERLRAEEERQNTDPERAILNNLNCKVIFIMREEYVALLNKFEEKVPELTHKKLRLEPIADKVLIETVIPGLCDASSMILLDESDADSDMESPESVAAAIVQQVDIDGFVNLSYLNFYLKTLWDRARPTDDGTRKVTHQLVNDTGRVQDLLNQWLELQKNEATTKLLEKYPIVTTSVVGEILSRFVTPEGLSKSRNQEEILVQDVSPQLVDDCLNLLEDANILRHTPYQTQQGKGNRFELTDLTFAQHIHKAWSDPQRQYNSARSMIQDAYESYKASQTNLLSQFNPFPSFLVLPDASLALILPHEQRLRAELQPEAWAYWLKNKDRIQSDIRKEIKQERWIKWLIVILAIVVGGFMLYQLHSLSDRKQQLSQMEGNRLLQLLDRDDEQGDGSTAAYADRSNQAYDNPSLKYQIAVAADSALPDDNKIRAIEWQKRLQPSGTGIPFYNLSIDAYGPVKQVGFLPDGRVYALSSHATDPVQVWTLDTTGETWSKTDDPRQDVVIPKNQTNENTLSYGTTEEKVSLRKKLRNEDNESANPLLIVSDDSLLRVRRGSGGSVKVYEGSTSVSGSPILLKGHQTPVISADLWTNTTTGMRLLLTADTTGLIRIYRADNFCKELACLAKLLPAEKSDLGLELTNSELKHLASSRDWTKLSQYLFKIENRYHERGQKHGAGLDSIVLRLTNRDLLAKQTPTSIYRFWRRVVSLAKTEDQGHSKKLYNLMRRTLENYMLQWPPSSAQGNQLAKFIASSNNQLDLQLGVQFLENWGKRYPKETFRLQDYLYNQAINLNALDVPDVKAYLEFIRRREREINLYWVINNLSVLNRQAKLSFKDTLRQATFEHVKHAIARLPEEEFRTTSSVETVLSVVDDPFWSAVRIAEYQRRMPTDKAYYQKQMVEAYGNLAYFQILSGDFKAAIQSARSGMNQQKQHDVNTEWEWIYTNLALAYLLDGQMDNARPLYQTLKDSSYTMNEVPKNFRQAFIEDLAEVEQRGKIPPARKNDVEEIRQLLKSKQLFKAP